MANIPRKSIDHLKTYDNIHMSSKLLTKDKIDFTKYFNAPSIRKPQGFWYSLGTDWLSWVRSEMPHWEYPFLYELLIDKSKLLIINNTNDLLNFINEYSIANSSIKFDNRYEYKKINWYILAKKYSGIEFSNYRKSYLLNKNELNTLSLWYDGIDVSSGCIWNKNALISINLIQEDCK
mgnify:CR=1 FL=1